MRGKFISFEGGESGGKSTQAAKLSGFLMQRGIEVVETREPGGTPQSEAIRDLLVRGDPNRWGAYAEILLFTAARAEHVARLIEPALARGAWVICDRFIDSCYAYQGIANGLGLEFTRDLQAPAIGNSVPDVTFLLDVPVEIALARADERNAESRFEHKDLSYHEAVRQGFLQLAQDDKARIVTIDATQSFDAVCMQVEAEIVKRFDF